MANPQKENGYLSIANEIVDRLIGLGLSGREYEVVLFVIRKTYGFNKKEDRIAISQFERGLGIHRSTACKLINSLVAKRLLDKHDGVYSFNKNWEQWEVVAKRPLVAKSPLVAKRQQASRHLANELVAKSPPTKDTLTKDTIQKTIAEPSSAGEEPRKKTKKKPIEERYSPEVISQINTLLNKIHDTTNPNISYPNANNREEAAWLIHKYGLAKLLPLMDFADSVKADPFAPTPYTPKQLRDKMPAIINYYHRLQNTAKKNSIAII